MFNRLAIFSVVMAMAAFAAALPAPNIAFTNPEEKPLADGLTLVGATGNAVGIAVGTVSHTAQNTWTSTKNAADKTGKFLHDVKEDTEKMVHKAGKKTGEFIDESKEVSKNAAIAMAKKTSELTDDAKETTKTFLKATGDALATGTKFIVGTIAWGATGLYMAGEKGFQAIGDFSHAAKERVVIVLRPASPSNIKRKTKESFICVKNSVKSFAYDFTCHYDQGYTLVFKPNTKEIFCDKDGKREDPIKRSDAEKEADKDTEYEVSAYEVSE